MQLNLQDTFNKELPADPNLNNTRRQVKEACFSFVTPRIPSSPKLLHVSKEMARAIGLDQDDWRSDKFLKVFSGSEKIEGTNPYAMCYGGHQFGHWAGQLGDGRAIVLGEVVEKDQRWMLQLKGAGETPYSRSADGLAVLRSSIREHLCSEAMFHLGVPTTRSLSLCLTGDQVMRDVMYDGNPAYEKGAVVCRVAPSFIRFGNFEILASRGDKENLKRLADYTLKYFYPEIKSEGKDAYISLFNALVDNTRKMIVEWQRVGFVHGVMNTDNMSILGLTIDYGPYGWLEGYDKQWTPNTTDKQNRRYRFGNQAMIGLWNLYQLANALFPLIEDAKPLEDALERYKKEYAIAFQKMMRSKLGFTSIQKGDADFVTALEEVLSLVETDMTIFFRLLSNVDAEDDSAKAIKKIETAFYTKSLPEEFAIKWRSWFEQYILRLKKESIEGNVRKESMDKVNPKYVLRNYMAQLAIDEADKGEYALIDELYQMLKDPYSEQAQYQKWFSKRPEWARNKVGCSMLSCSS